MKKKNIFIGSILITLIMMFSTSSIGASITAQSKEYTDQYKQWMNLSAEEKTHYIQPLPSSVDINTVNSDKRLRATSNLPSKYNLADDINIKIKNQMGTGQCWAFSVTTVLETNIEKKTGKTSPFFSARHMDYATTKTFKDGTNKNGFNRELKGGGNPLLAYSYLTNGTGAVLESDMPFVDNEEKIELSEIKKTPVQKVDDYILYPSVYKYKENGVTINYNGGNTQYTDEQVNIVRSAIKTHVMQNGGVTAMTSGERPEFYSNQEDPIKSESYYCDDKAVMATHAITIVGWDDEYPIEKFNENHRPTKPGAYIALNSYGKENFAQGYIYVSYEDSLIESLATGIINSSEMNYNNLYQNDFYGASNILYLIQAGIPVQDQTYVANVFKREKTDVEKLEKVSLAIEGSNKIEIYVNPTGSDIDISKMKKVYTSTENISNSYATIKLDETVDLTGTEFAIAVKYITNGTVYFKIQANIPNSAWGNATATAGNSFVSLNGKQWTDLTKVYPSGTATIKAYTAKKSVPPIDDTNNTTNNITNNTTNNTTTNNTTNSNTTNSSDNTTANTIIPNAGKFYFGLIISIIFGISVISYINYKRYNNMMK